MIEKVGRLPARWHFCLVQATDLDDEAPRVIPVTENRKSRIASHHLLQFSSAMLRNYKSDSIKIFWRFCDFVFDGLPLNRCESIEQNLLLSDSAE